MAPEALDSRRGRPPHDSARWERISGAFSVALLVLQPVFFYWHVLIHPVARIPYDLEGYHLPLMAYIGRCVRQGIAPFWDPYSYCGVPLYGDMTAQLYYPFTWLALWLGNHSGGRNIYYWIEWLIPFHMMLAGIFTFLLLRRMGLRRPAALLGATAYQLGGYFATQVSHLGATCCAAWLPPTILAVTELARKIERRWICILVASIALSILSGYAATVAVVAGATVLYALALLVWRQATWRLLPTVAVSMLAGVAAAAVQVVPTGELSLLSMASLRGHWQTAWGAPLQSLVSLVWPNYYHIFQAFTPEYKLPYNFTFLYIYCGLIPLVLVLLVPFVPKTPSAWMFLTLTVISAIWMLGEHTPIYTFLFNRLPVAIRGPLYAWLAMMAFCLFFGITAALVLDRLGTRVPQSVLWILVLITSADLIFTGRDRPMNTYAGSYKTSNSEYQLGSDYRIGGSPGALERIRAMLGNGTPPLRIDYADTSFWSGILSANMLQLPTADGDNPFALRRMVELRRLFSSGKPSDRNLPVTRFDSPLLRMLNVGVLASRSEIPAAQLERAGLQPAGEIAGMHFYRVPALPRFFLVPRILHSSGASETFRLLARREFNPAEEAVVEGLSPSGDSLGSGEVTVTQYEPNLVELAVSSSGPAFLVTSEPLYPGWTASVNGQSQPLLMTNGAFRGLRLARGAHRVVMNFHPPYFWPSLLFSAVTLAFAVTLGLRPHRSAPNVLAGQAIGVCRLPGSQSPG